MRSFSIKHDLPVRTPLTYLRNELGFANIYTKLWNRVNRMTNARNLSIFIKRFSGGLDVQNLLKLNKCPKVTMNSRLTIQTAILLMFLINVGTLAHAS